jgi:hypothetical protein
MTYGELIDFAFNAYYENGRNYPANLLYPIVSLNNDKIAVDIFMDCYVKRDQTGKVFQIKEPLEILCCTLDSKSAKFVSITTIQEDCQAACPKLNLSSSIDDFQELYMQVREFAFMETLTIEQANLLQKLLFIYDCLFEPELRNIYHKFGGAFFRWAYHAVA